MHGSKLPLTIWFWAVYLMATHSNGISALQLQKQLALGSYKSAWLLCAKLRRAMVAPNRALLSGLAEVDEMELPLRTKDDPVTGGGGGRSGQSKMLVAGAVEVADGVVGRIRLGKSPTFPPNCCMDSSRTTSLPARRSKPTDGPPIEARRASITIQILSGKWPPTLCWHGFIASSRT
jgi:hypothetical protein